MPLRLLPTPRPREKPLHLQRRKKLRPREVKRSRRPLNRLRKRRLKKNARELKPKKQRLLARKHSRRDLTELESSSAWEEESITLTQMSHQRGPSITSGSYLYISETLQMSQLTPRFYTCKCALQPSRELSWQTVLNLTSVKSLLLSRRPKKY
jgi:hypothetical protein